MEMAAGVRQGRQGFSGKSTKGIFQPYETVERTYTNDSFAPNELKQVRTLYEDGKLVYMPAPTADPKDPLNLPMWRKYIAIISLCFFGAMAAAAELILGAMLPVFDLQYSNIDPKLLLELENGLPDIGENPLVILADLPFSPPIWQIYLLASLPILMMGVANFFLIPVAIAIGRRPVIIICGLVAIAGCSWAGNSTSLGTHLGARTIQALGAGTVESLLPFIIQDMVFLHQRNTAISGVFACQGLIIVSLGIAAPYVIGYLSWRWIYFITAIAAGFFLILVILFCPESKWHRTRSEMQGNPLYALPPGKDRHDIDPHRYGPRTLWYDLALYRGPTDWPLAWIAVKDTLRTFFLPHIIFVTLLNAIMIATALAAGYTTAPALLTYPWSWPFEHLGLCLMSVLIAAIAVYGVTGFGADALANYFAKKTGTREPEVQLLNLILPTIVGVIGSVIFGVAGDNRYKYSWGVFLLGLGFMAFGFLAANTIGAVYVLESYPHLAGPALVNIASVRLIIAFCISFKVSDFIVYDGYLPTFCAYAGAMAGLGLFIPVIYIYGGAWRRRWPAD